jgi:predicted signal transduction protein with EAL and GGDEF domain
VTVLSRLRTLGVRIAVDDYGSGYSSLAYLVRLAIDELKIDKAFILGMRGNEDDSVIVRSTIELGHNLGLQLVAEGVEDAETWQLAGGAGVRRPAGLPHQPAGAGAGAGGVARRLGRRGEPAAPGPRRPRRHPRPPAAGRRRPAAEPASDVRRSSSC